MVSIEESEHLELGTGCAAEGWGIVIISSLRMSCQGRGGGGGEGGQRCSAEGRTRRRGWKFVVAEMTQGLDSSAGCRLFYLMTLSIF